MVIPVPMFKVPRCAGYGPRAGISCRKDAAWEVMVYIFKPHRTVYLCTHCMRRFWRVPENRLLCDRKELK